MKATRIMTLVAPIIASGLIWHAVPAQQPGVTRTELHRYDLSIPGREVIQVRVDLDPGVTFPLHSHPGEEVIYVLEGVWEYQVEGKGGVRVKAGEVLFIPHGVKHAAKNVGSGNKSVTGSAATVADGNGGNNYTVSYAGNTTSSHITALLVSQTAGSQAWMDESPRRSSISVVMLLATQLTPVTTIQKPASKALNQ